MELAHRGVEFVEFTIELCEGHPSDVEREVLASAEGVVARGRRVSSVSRSDDGRDAEAVAFTERTLRP